MTPRDVLEVITRMGERKIPGRPLSECDGTGNTEAGRRKAALSQALTKNVGYPKLREHPGATVAYMTMSKGYPDFMEKLNKVSPAFWRTVCIAVRL
jgi:hypothetical protein